MFVSEITFDMIMLFNFGAYMIKKQQKKVCVHRTVDR